MADSVDVSSLGISRERVEPPQRCRDVPFSRRVFGKVVISDEESEKEEENGDWVKVQYGKKKKKTHSQQRQGHLPKGGKGNATSPRKYFGKNKEWTSTEPSIDESLRNGNEGKEKGAGTECPIQDGDEETVDVKKTNDTKDSNASDTRLDNPETKGSMDVNSEVESEMKQYSETRTDCPIQDGDGKTVDAEKCAESEDLNSSDTRLDNPATETKQCEVEFRHPLLVQNNSEKEDNYFEEDGDEVCGFEKQSEVFFVGRKFSSMSELETAKKVYEDSHYFELWKRDVRTLTSAAKRVPKKVAKANQDLKYYSLRLTCKFGGKAVESGKVRKRKTKSFRQGCPFEVYIALSEDGKYLQVNRISKQHNHALKKQIYERLPRQRAARCKNVAKDIEDAIQLQANPKLLKEKIENASGKRVTLKDISNIKQNSMKHLKKNDLEN